MNNTIGESYIESQTCPTAFSFKASRCQCVANIHETLCVVLPPADGILTLYFEITGNSENTNHY